MNFVFLFFMTVLFFSVSELYLLVEVSRLTSFAVTFGLCAFTGLAGGGLVRHQGLRTIQKIHSSIASGNLPADEIVSGLMLLIMGAFLIVPGFITDIIAIILLIPFVRLKIAGMITSWFKNLIARKAVNGMKSSFNSNEGGFSFFSAGPHSFGDGQQPFGSGQQPFGTNQEYLENPQITGSNKANESQYVYTDGPEVIRPVNSADRVNPSAPENREGRVIEVESEVVDDE